MKINEISGWLEGVKKVPSPNYDDFPKGGQLELIVIHNISLPPGEFGGEGIEQLFQNKLDPNEHTYYKDIATIKVSAHILIRRDGNVVQFVPFNKRAWHAGVSNFCGKEGCNDFSLGIEMEGTDEQPFTSIQYEKLIELTGILLTTYPSLSAERVAGHCDIAPGRKTDPGESFDWKRYLSGIV